MQRHTEKPVLDKQKLTDSFNLAVGTYDASSRLQKFVGEQLMDRLQLMKIRPEAILDLGSGPGQCSRELAKKYTSARVVQLDIAERMLGMSRKQDSRFFSRQTYLCADADNIPIVENSMALVFSNLMLQWSQDPDSLLAGLARVIRPDGLFVFSSLGPGTLRELRECWATVDDQVHVNNFIDMHDLGDALIRAGFTDPVMESEIMTLSYLSLDGLFRDLKGLGAHNVNISRRRTLTGKQRFRTMQAEYEKRKQDDRLPASYEVIFGHAWLQTNKHEPGRVDSGLFRISLDQLRQTIKNSGNKDDNNP